MSRATIYIEADRYAEAIRRSGRVRVLPRVEVKRGYIWIDGVRKKASEVKAMRRELEGRSG